LPVFPAAHFAKVAKLALSGLKQGNFSRSNRRENFGHLTMSRQKTAPVADFKTAQKACRTLQLRGVRRESHRVIRSAAKTAMSHVRTSLKYPRQFLVFFDSFSEIRH